MEYCPYCMEELTGRYCIYCGKQADEVKNGFNLPAGTTLWSHRYVVGRVLGQGGFGVTYLGRDTRLNRAVAIKEYVPISCAYRDTKSQWIRPYPEQVQQEFFEKGKRDFLEEVRLAAEQSSGRQSIVDVYDYFEENNTAYFVMEYLNGDSMQDFVKAHGPYKPAYLFALMAPLMRDLAEIHKRSVLHRDIAPNNIMHIKSDRLKLIDFGSARRLYGDRTMSILVHDGYAPPEQFIKEDQGPYTDVYALAATMYYCLTGEVPINSIARIQTDTSWKNEPLRLHLKKRDRVTERQNDSLPSLLEKKVQVTERQNDAIMHALCVCIDERTQDIQQFMDELYGKKEPPEEKKQPLNPIRERLEELRQENNDKETRSGQGHSKEGEIPIQDYNYSEKQSDRTEPAGGYGTLTPVRDSDPVPQGGEMKPTEPKIEPVGDESVNKDMPPSGSRADPNSGKQPPQEQIIPPYRPHRQEVPEYRPVVTPNQPLDKRLVAGIGAALLLLLILVLIPILHIGEEKETEKGTAIVDWLPGYWYLFDETESCTVYYIRPDGTWDKSRCSLNTDRNRPVSTGTVTEVEKDVVIIDQIQWKYQKDNDRLVQSGQIDQPKYMIHSREQLTIEERKSRSGGIVEMNDEVEPEPEAEPELAPEPEPEAEPEPGAEPEPELASEPEPELEYSWTDGYWYLFNEEGKLCAEYQFQEDGTYQVQERYLANGNGRTRVNKGEYSCVEGTLHLGTDSWDYAEEEDIWYRFEDNVWGTESAIIMLHSLSKAGVAELDEGYSRFMEYNEEGVYEYKVLSSAETALIYAYPSVFQEITTENETYADGAAMKPLEVFQIPIGSYYYGYRSKDGDQALFYSFWNIPSDFEAINALQSIADKVHCDFIIEEESASEVDWFRLLMNIDGRWHFIRCVIDEENNGLSLMEYSFTGENYYPYNSAIAHLEHNLEYISITE